VGSELIKGVSGGERKRVSLAEAMLSGSALQCWDNSTRGLDSANAVEFCATLKAAAELAGTTMLVALYQAPQAAYEVSGFPETEGWRQKGGDRRVVDGKT
jgi:ABC-type multidrug transport system ATPase subunit